MAGAERLDAFALMDGRLDQLDVTRVEASLPDDPALRSFFSARGYTDAGCATFVSNR